ncbi:MAG: beta-N-acetylhexosaminidase [Actinomycetota bacterium]|nr:beta-N-acetylhexosaminidase [Actinomycetota bacterium]
MSTGSISEGSISAAGTLLPGFEGGELPDWLRMRLEGGLAGVCLFATNISSPEQLRRLTDEIRSANPDAVIAIDEEGGDVTRLFQAVGSPYPGAAILGRLDDLEYTREIAGRVGRQLRAVGVTLDFAPDADINSSDDNPVIGTRSFGADPELVARHTAAWVEGLQSTGVAASAKHFPGHGDTASDSHLSLPVIDLPLATLRVRELVPFAAAIGAGTATIMTSHILLPELDEVPATFSPRILGGLLREELGFAGVIVSDALDMRGASGVTGIPDAAVRALVAGCDLLCIGTANTDTQLDEIEAAVAAAVSDGRLPSSRLADALARVATLAPSLVEPVETEPVETEPVETETETEPSFSLDRTISAFDVVPDAPAPLESHLLVQLETVANIAVGPSPWGAAAAGAPVRRLLDGDALPDTDRQLILIGRDNHRRDWTRAVIDAARARDPRTLVVDMGWPSADRRYADVATFGASRHAGQALLRWLPVSTGSTSGGAS